MVNAASPTTRSIVFLSDFGYRNEWVGICHAVMSRIAPASPVIDLSHGVPPLGPDNGLLCPFWHAAEGAARAVSITSSSVVLSPVSASFHARDVLAPATAHLAVGLRLEELGDAGERDTLAQIQIPNPTVEQGRIECEVLDLNRFGNVQLNVRGRHVAAAGLDRLDRVSVESHSGSGTAQFVSTYADLQPGEWGLMPDPRGWLSVIRGNPANAAEGLGLTTGDLVWLAAPRA